MVALNSVENVLSICAFNIFKKTRYNKYLKVQKDKIGTRK